MILLSFVKNNKASILPVTIVSMFVLIIIGYASLKIGISRSNIATTEQIKMRTLYAAEGVTESMKTNLYNYINNYTVRASTIAQTSLTNFDPLPKSSTGEFQGDNKKFEKQIIFAGFNGFDFNDFDSNFGTTYGNTYPKIKISTYVVVTSSTTGKSQTSPNIGIEVKSKGLQGRVIDTGMEFYRQRIGSLPNVPSSSTTYRNSGFNVRTNNNYINNICRFKLSDVYINGIDYLAGIDYQGKGLVYKTNPLEGLKVKPCFFVFDVTGKNNDYRPRLSYESPIFEFDTNPFDNHKTAIENYVTSKNATSASFVIYEPTDYFIKHSSRGYVFSVTAENAHKPSEPVVSCTINTYFDLYAMGLYRKCKVYRVSLNRTHVTYYWSVNPITEYQLVDIINDSYRENKLKKINKVRYVIQRQEVIVN